MFSRKLTRSIVAGAVAIAVAGGSYGIISATSSSSPAAARSGSAGGFRSGGGGSNARAGGGGGSAASPAAKVIPFQHGAPATARQAGQIPANYSQGSGTIVSGTAANQATEAALAAYPGGIADRVVKLSNGEYKVHYIGVNWPHHIFVNQDFKVVGAE